MLKVGLTGNIACGKSHATRIFSRLGARVIDADTVVHELLSPGTETYCRLLDEFGPSILNTDQTVNRKVLGGIVFANAEKRGVLNGIVHPEVRRQIGIRIADIESTGSDGIVIVDAALMIETGSYKLYDRVVVVTCDPEIQLKRVIIRDQLTEQEARARIAAQLPSAEKVKFADYVVDTSGSFRETRHRIEAVYRSLMADAAGAATTGGPAGISGTR
jgi:dephospho-CoA kinase